MLWNLLLFASVLACPAWALDEKCPVGGSIKPCTCKTYFDGACIITCSLAQEKDLEKIADIPNLCGGNVHFVLVHSKVSGIPAKLWSQLLSSKTVDVTIKRAGVENLVTPGQKIPKAYTTGAAIIKIDHSKVETWDWSQLKEFYSEGELTIIIDDTPLSELGSDFTQIANGQVHKVTLDSTGLTKLQDNEFVPFDDITSLSLQNNELTMFSRSMIAKPAKSLQFLALNGNSLTTLPDDLFLEMPVLEIVYLRDNKFKYLSLELFQSISSPKLLRVDLVNNPWVCDCKLLHVLQNTKQHQNMGTCDAPAELAGKKVVQLSNFIKC